MNNQRKDYLPQLTWLRGVAAVLVLISHSVRTTELPYSPNDTPSNLFLFNSLDLGSFAVTLFFCLSGATLYMNHKHDEGFNDLKKFILKRVFRIYPAFIISMLAYVILANIYISLYGAPKGIWMDVILTPYSKMDVFTHIFLLYDLFGKPYIINGAFWSLPVEFRYYLFFPLALLCLRYIGVLSVLVFSVFLACTLYLIPWKPSIPYFFMLAPSFFGGVLAAYFFEKKMTSLKVSPLVIVACFAIASCVWVNRDLLPKQFSVIIYYNAFIVLCVLIVYFALRMKVDSYNFKLKKFLSFIGKVSYSLYLLHQLVLTFVFILCMRIGITGDWKILFIFPITLVISLLISWVSYKYIESTGVDFCKRIINKQTKTTIIKM